LNLQQGNRSDNLLSFDREIWYPGCCREENQMAKKKVKKKDGGKKKGGKKKGGKKKGGKKK
jgi:hypothetical protein